MTEFEKAWDRHLQIHTAGRDDSRADEYRYPYEPTPYCVLERLADSGVITPEDTVLDYGCGKGRVDFFLSYHVHSKCIGIEYDEQIYASAIDNRKKAVSGADFVLSRAEIYEVPPEVNRFYFFNPLSVEILRKVMARILESYYAQPRELRLLFYYPSDEYVCCLMTVDELEFYDEIECRDLFPGSDLRERILIFKINA